VGKDYKSSPTKTVYDSMMQAFANNIRNKEELKNNAEMIRKKLYKNKKELVISKERNKLLFDGRYVARNDVIARIDYYHKFLQDYIS
jgi:hypothetical protein